MMSFDAVQATWPSQEVLLVYVVISPILEEIVFRVGLHDAFRARVKTSFGPLTTANVLTAIVFGCIHALLRQSPAGFMTALPALLFGFAYERWHRLSIPICLHAVSNLIFWAVIVPTGINWI